MKNSLENIIAEFGRELNGKISTPIIVGGWAVNLLGFPRNTLDFDFMIYEEEFDAVVATMKKVDYILAVKTSLYARFQSKEKNKMPYIDCLFANKNTYDKLAKAGTAIDIFGTRFILPEAIHIIAMKLHAVKHGEKHRLWKDFNDIISLIEIHNIDVSSSSEFAKLCSRYADDEIYERIINAAE
jgi:hypothetical protein